MSVSDETCLAAETSTAGAVGPSSTTAPISHETTTGGIDTLTVTLKGTCNSFLFSVRCKELQEAQAAAAQNDEELRYVEIGGCSCRVAPKGASGGNCWFHYVLETGGTQIAINANSDNADHPVAKVIIGSETLTRLGALSAWEQTIGLLKRGLQLEVTDTQVSRVDLCVDLPDVDAKDLIELFRGSETCITKIDSQLAPYHDRGERPHSIKAGKETLVRIYDKARELREKPNETKQEAVERYRWGKACETAARVEFQLTRTPLRDTCGVNTIEDLWQKLPAITEWLTSRWLRLVEPFDFENNNHSRATTHELWRQVQEAFRLWAGNATAKLERRERRKPELQNLQSQAMGCLTTIAAYLMPDGPFDDHGVIDFIREYLKEVDVEDLARDVLRKQKKLAALGKADERPEWYELTDEYLGINRAA